MGIRRRLAAERGTHSLVDGIPFEMPVSGHHTPALIAGFTVDLERAGQLLPPGVQALRIWRRGLLLITVVDYRETVIGKYIEFSIAIACTRGTRPPPPLLPLVFQRAFNMGQYVYDLPVSTEISVKGGKGIWGMPKHQASLDFRIGERKVSSQYDLDGSMAVRIEVDRPAHSWLPLRSAASNYCSFRGMLFKSNIYFSGSGGFSLFRKGSARLCLGRHQGLQPLRELDINPNPVFAGFFPHVEGLLDDHVESWFLRYDRPPEIEPEGLESVVGLGLSQEWPPPPVEEPDCEGVARNSG